MEAGELKTNKSLSNDVLLEIFSWLDADSLREATLVCKDWNELIGSSASTMNKFKLCLDRWKFNLNGQDMSYHRKYQNVFIDFKVKFNTIDEFLGHFNVSSARELYFLGTKSFDIRKLLPILKKMPMVENFLYLSNKNIVSDPSQVQQMILPKLKHLEIYAGNCKCLQFITAMQLNALIVHEDKDLMMERKDTQELIKFLERSENLEILEITSRALINVFDCEAKLEAKFKIQIFALSNNDSLPSTMWENFNNFLMSQESSLKNLDFGYVENFPPLIFSTIFTKLRRLNKWSFLASTLPMEQQFYDKIRPLFALTELALWNEFESDEAAKGQLGSCPNLAILNIEGPIGNEINFMAEYNRKLEKLTVESLNTLVSDNFRFNNLKSLTVIEIDNVDHLMSLITKSPKIENLIVKWVEKDKLNDDAIDLLVQQASLRFLSLTGQIDVIKLIFNKIKTNYGCLKTLELTVLKYNFIGSYTTPCLKLNFPEDFSDWIIEKQQMKFDEAISLL